MKKAIIINKGFSDNLGDQAIGRAMEEILSPYYDSVLSFDLTQGLQRNTCIKTIELREIRRDNYKLIKTLRWKSKSRSIVKTLQASILNCDAVFVGGGELIQDNNSFPPSLLSWIRLIRMQQPIVPIHFFGVGVTNEFSCLGKHYIECALKQVDTVFVRDEVSRINLKACFNYDSYEIPDVAFALDLNCYNRRETKKDTIALGITAPFRIRQYNSEFSSQNYFQKMLDYVSKLKSKNITLCYTDSNDYAACKCFVQFLLQNNVDCSHIGIGDYNNLDGFLSFLSSQECIVSPRMHACILGLKYNLDTFPILISPKMRAFASKYINNRTNVDNNRTLILDAINRIAACR